MGRFGGHLYPNTRPTNCGLSGVVHEDLPPAVPELQLNSVVTDRNRVTGHGVTAGLDFGLDLIARPRTQPPDALSETADALQFAHLFLLERKMI